MFRFASLASLAIASVVLAQTYDQSFTPDTAPKTWQPGQAGTNQCGKGSDQNSMCQNVYGAPSSPSP